jgi:hypothetical protein
MRSFYSLVLAILLFVAVDSRAQVAKEYALELSAQVQQTPPRITIRWVEYEDVQVYTIYRRLYGETTWGKETIVEAPTDGYTDNNVEAGKLYEYRVQALRGDKSSIAFITSGIEIPARAREGTLLMLVASEAAASCAPEIERYIDDVIRIGYNVEMQVVSESETPQQIKAKILEVSARLGNDLRSLFLFGRVPIPYSGNIFPDGHTDTKGAWPADMYYGDLDGEWTDKTVNNRTASVDKHDNVPNDGKFDQSVAPSRIELEVGRVDMRHLSPFYPDASSPAEREARLLRNYLDKNHAFRTVQLSHNGKAVVSDVLNKLGNNDIPAAIAWRGFPLLTTDVQPTTTWMETLKIETHLWAYGGGYGNYFVAEQVGTTQDYATHDPKAIFTMLFGSRFGIWDSEDNLLRAPLATSTGLASMWAGRPYWYVHQMGMGMTIGEATRHSQSASTSYIPTVGDATVMMSLMGDPTLRNTEIANTMIDLKLEGNTLSWLIGFNPDRGYYVSRSPSPKGPFKVITPEMISTSTFTDPLPDANEPYYLVRPIIAMTTKSGTFHQSGRGVIVGPDMSVDEPLAAGALQLRDAALDVNADGELVIIDILGRVMLERNVRAGERIEIGQLMRGAYIAKLARAGAAEQLGFFR